MELKNNDIKLAEMIGILLGDGSLSLKENNPKSINRLQITLNSRDDLEYISYVKTLLHELLGIQPHLKFRKNENAADLRIYRKEIINFLIKNIGLKLSPKWERAVIPAKFLENNLDTYVIRGYFDTDGSLVTTNNNGTIYPRLEMKVCPSPMQNQFIQILKKYNFKFGVYNIGKGKVRIQLNGKEQLKKWLCIIGSSNQKHLDKVKRFI
ncbi:hypothetical protein HYU06_02100 [Candidatus Woesearchaeota archaeon]|nr:hypothetical protein [Candidatus Woesearchaeota archaeon]